MGKLFNREVSIQVGELLIRSRIDERQQVQPLLRVTFKVERSRLREPNKAEIRIYNLKKDNRQAIGAGTLKKAVIIEAGYIDNIFGIFSGDLELVENVQDGRDWISTLQASDGGNAYRQARINTSIKGPAKVQNVLETIGNALKAAGIDLGNLKEKASKGSIRGALSEFTNGIVLSGKAEQSLDKVVKAMGYSWSIQDNKLQLLEPTEVIGTSVVLLTPGTGLVGSPESGEDGILKVRSLIQADLEPGKRLKIESAEVDGFFRAEKSTYVGDTWSGEWYVDVECKPL